MVDLTTTAVDKSSLKLSVDGVDLSDPTELAKEMKLEQQVEPVSQFFKGGTSQAKAIFQTFLEEKFSDYDDNRNQPQTSDVSHMSKYLHFGQVSPVYLVQEVRHSSGSQKNIESFVEEVVVRRELAMNFVNFTSDYDSYTCLPDWAKKNFGRTQGRQARRGLHP